MAPAAINEAPPRRDPTWADRDALRARFALAMSAMYKAEVPLYGDLVRIVSDVNASTLSAAAQGAPDPRVLHMRYGDSRSRLDVERHGAIRLGTPHELRTIARVFAVIGLYPVGYYDLSAAGLPMHATCFRPHDRESLSRNPFRVFASLLRPELVRDAAARDIALELLSRRNIFTDNLMRLLDRADEQGGNLTGDQGDLFVAEAIKTFQWHSTAAATYGQYEYLKSHHPILADIVCFRSSHINHLTPRTLDITRAQDEMRRHNLMVKDRIEGPPPRSCPILLRQTSFLAVEEPIKFPSADGRMVTASHRARFGEIEERGAAVSPEGRRLYDQLLGAAMAAAQGRVSSEKMTAAEMDGFVEDSFGKYPDSWEELRRRGLVYFTYQCTASGSGSELEQGSSYSVEQLVAERVLEPVPITYEDFLPLSAAGIFQSNLGSTSPSGSLPAIPDAEGMQSALGARLSDSDELYRRMQSESIAACESKLGIRINS